MSRKRHICATARTKSPRTRNSHGGLVVPKDRIGRRLENTAWFEHYSSVHPVPLCVIIWQLEVSLLE